MTKKEAMPYLKLYRSYLDDMDFIELARETRSRYWDFYLLAWNADAGGDLINRETGKPLTVKNMALRLRDDATAVSNDLAALAAAGFMTITGDTWNITRYTEEQDNQQEYRDKQNKRQAKSRENREIVTRESHVTIEQDKLSKDNLSQEKTRKEKEREAESQSISQENEAPPDGPNDRPAATAATATTANSSNSLSNVKPYAEEQTENHPGLHELALFWKERTGVHITRFSQRLINTKLHEGMTPDIIREKIEKTALREPGNPDAYFAECMKPEKADPVFIESVIRTRELRNVEELNKVLKEYNVIPPAYEQLIEWGIVTE